MIDIDIIHRFKVGGIYFLQSYINEQALDIIEKWEKKFDVKVVKVATINQSGKHKQMIVRSGGRTIRTSGKRSDYKKAIITLDSDSTIDLMRGEAAN